MRKIFKRSLACCLILALSLTMFTGALFTATATTSPAFTISALSADKGEAVSIDMTVSGLSTVAAYQFRLILPEVLTDVSVASSDITLSAWDGSNGNYMISADSYGNPTIAFLDLYSLADLTADTVTFTIGATVAEDAVAGDYDFAIANVDAVDEDGVSFEYTSNFGALTVNEPEVPTCEHTSKTYVSAVINSDSTEDGAVVGEITFTCDNPDCGETIVEEVTYDRSAMLAGSNASVGLDETTVLNLRLNNTNYGDKAATDLFVVSTFSHYDGITETVSLNIADADVTPSSSDNYYTWYLPIDYNKLGSNIEIHVFRKESTGNWTTGLVRNYSAKKSLMSIINAGSDQNSMSIAANLLNAGAESQKLMDSNIADENLVTSDLTDAQKALIVTTTPTISNTEANWKPSSGHADLGYAYFTTPQISLGETVKFSTKLDLRYVDAALKTDLKIAYSYNAAVDGSLITGEILPEDCVYDPSNGRYAFDFAVKAPNMRQPITFTVYSGETVISNEIIYSIEATMQRAMASNSAYQGVINALINYSDVIVAANSN